MNIHDMIDSATATPGRIIVAIVLAIAILKSIQFAVEVWKADRAKKTLPVIKSRWGDPRVLFTDRDFLQIIESTADIVCEDQSEWMALSDNVAKDREKIVKHIEQFFGPRTFRDKFDERFDLVTDIHKLNKFRTEINFQQYKATYKMLVSADTYRKICNSDLTRKQYIRTAV